MEVGNPLPNSIRQKYRGREALVYGDKF